MLGGTRTINWLKKTKSIVLLGLESAGKTTFVNQWARGKVTQTMATLGLDVEHVEVGNESFNLIDLGGQEPFRLRLWQTYAQMASGVIFVFDITNRKKAEESVKWFWKIQGWLQPGTQIMFCANKIDLKGKDGIDAMDLPEIIESFNLKKFADDPQKGHSFRIFECSALTGENISYAMSWMFEKLQRRQQMPALRKAVIAHVKGKIICDIPFMDEKLLTSDTQDINQLILSNKKLLLNKHGALEIFEGEYSTKIVLLQNKHLCIVSASKDANYDSIRVVVETIMSLFLTQLANKTFNEDFFKEIIRVNFNPE